MRVQVHGKDAGQITGVYISFITFSILKITVNTRDKWIGLGDNGDSFSIDHETSKKPHFCLRTSPGCEHHVELVLFAENEQEKEILMNHVCYESQNKDQPTFILIHRKTLLEANKHQTKLPIELV